MRAHEFTTGVVEEVNPDITSDEYFIDPTKNVRMGDFVFNARTFTGGLGNPNARGLQIRAYDPKRPKGHASIGSADFIVKSDAKGRQWLESDDTEVDDEYRGKGVAAMMYAFARSLGNDIKDSPHKSKAGGDMWRKWGADAKHLVGEQSVAEAEDQINELGDAPAEYQPNRRRKRSLFHATVDGNWVDVFFDRSEFNDTLHITFAVNGDYDTPSRPTEASKSTVRILSTVLNIVKQRLPEYMTKARPPAVSFTAKGDNRAGLYRKYFVPVIQNILGPKWTHEEYPSMGMTVFHWRPVKKQQDVAENFADGKVKGRSRPGRVKRAGASCDGSVSDLRAKARKYGGEKGKMYHWCANMKGGKK